MTINSSPNRSLLRGIGILYILLIVTMAVATIVEHAIGSEGTHSMIYGSWWFVGLWAMLVVTGTMWLLRQLRRRPVSFNTIITFIIHLSLVVILVGAFITHVGSQQGIIHLRGDQPTNLFDNMGSGDAGMKRQQLPFYLKLDRFSVRYHAGTDTPEDYETYFSIIDGHQTLHASVSMNRIFSYRHYRLYQASYDTDN
ncbi:MAG: cytochrome c biogenesis protein ResB, partial [Prevotella sp.]